MLFYLFDYIEEIHYKVIFQKYNNVMKSLCKVATQILKTKGTRFL
jgi:adenine-specific DNA methylase